MPDRGRAWRPDVVIGIEEKISSLVVFFRKNDVFLNLIQDPANTLLPFTIRGYLANNILSGYKWNNAQSL